MISDKDFGIIGEYWQPGKIMLDYDGTIPERAKEIAWVLEKMDIKIARFVVRPSRHGWHTVIETNAEDIPPMGICAIQAILGSDFRRETFNLARAMAMYRRVPKFHHTAFIPPFQLARWQILFRSKMEETQP